MDFQYQNNIQNISSTSTPINLLLKFKQQQKGLLSQKEIHQETFQQQIDKSVCLFDPSYEMQGIFQKPIQNLCKSHDSSLYAVQTQKTINLYESKDVKINYIPNMSAVNQLVQKKKQKLKAQLSFYPKLDTQSKQTVMYSMFHNIDAGLLYASDEKGQLHYFDLNNLQTSSENLTTSVIQFMISRNSPIHHMALPQYYQNHNLFSLSMALAGGLAFFDMREGAKVLQLRDIQAIQTKFYPENTNYLGVQTIQGSLELYDIRNMTGSVNVYSEQFAKEELMRVSQNVMDRQMKEQILQMKKDYIQMSCKRKQKEEYKEQVRQQNHMKDLIQMQTDLMVKPKMINNIEHLLVQSDLNDKQRLMNFRSNLQVENQISDFDFLSSTELLAITKAGVMKNYDFFSASLENQFQAIPFDKLQINNFQFKYKLQPLCQPSLNSQDYNNLNTQLYFIMSPKTLYLYDAKRQQVKQLTETGITNYTSVMLEKDHLDFQASRFLNNEANLIYDNEIQAGGFLIASDSAGVLRYQFSQ
eukprot:403347523